MTIDPSPVSGRERNRLLRQTIRILRRYRLTLALIAAATLICCLLGAILAYLLSPAVDITTVPFRLEFDGAERGVYPNGTKFSSAEIVSLPVTAQVHTMNDIDRYAKLEDFSHSFFVQESNADLEELEREYRSKLADYKLTPVDRERLEREYRLRLDSIAKSEFSLNFISSRATAMLPKSLIEKCLIDTLQVWAKQAADQKGVLRYRVPMLTADYLSRSSFENQDAILTLDVLRWKAVSIVRNIDLLLKVPGGEVVRPRPDGATLVELRQEIGDTIRFVIEPAIASIRAAGGTPNPAATQRYVDAQLAHNRMARDAMEARVRSLRESLQTYTQGGGMTPIGSTAADSAGEARAAQVTPQIDGGFIERILQLAEERSDVQYRQKQANEIHDASLEVLPYSSETLYYEQLAATLRGLSQSSQIAPDTAQAIATSHAQLSAAFREVQQIYAMMSRNLNPSTTLYTVTKPPTRRTERSLALTRALLFGLALFLIALPVILFFAWLHYRVRQEDFAENAEEASPEETG